MVLITVSGTCCSHSEFSIPEAQRLFQEYARGQLFRRILPDNDGDIGFEFNHETTVVSPKNEKFWVRVCGDLPATEHNARVIASCCSAAFSCYRCKDQEIATRCIIRNGSALVVATTTEKVKILYGR